MLVRGADNDRAPGGWLDIALRSDVRRRSLKVALLVGTILAAINYMDKLLVGTVSGTDLIKIGLTYLVPFAVSTHASVSTIRGDAGGKAARREDANSGGGIP
jgi:hypothetical protein